MSNYVIELHEKSARRGQQFLLMQWRGTRREARKLARGLRARHAHEGSVVERWVSP